MWSGLGLGLWPNLSLDITVKIQARLGYCSTQPNPAHEHPYFQLHQNRIDTFELVTSTMNVKRWENRNCSLNPQYNQEKLSSNEGNEDRKILQN